MLTENQKLLIAASLDGPLPAIQADSLSRLLETSGEARKLLSSLKSHQRALKCLPRVAAPAGLRSAVMAKLQPTLPKAQPSRRVSWVPYVMAASILLTVTAVSFQLFRPRSNPTEIELAQRNALPANSIVEPVAVAEVANMPPEAKFKPSANSEESALAKLDPVAEIVQPVPLPRTPEVLELFGSGLMVESKPLRMVELALPLILNATEFDKAEAKEAFEKFLAKEGGSRLDLFSKNPMVALEQFRKSAQAKGVNLFDEPLTAERLKKPAGFTFAVFLDNLTPAELAELFGNLAAPMQDKPKADTFLGTAHVIDVGAPETKELKENLGLDWTLTKAPAIKAPSEAKSVSSGTLEQLTASIKKPGEKAAIVLTVKGNAAKQPAGLKPFLDKRGERKPGTVPLLVIIRS